MLADAGWAGPESTTSHTAAMGFFDSEGEALDGTKKYTITFDMNNLPPVTEFWELPLYDAAGYFTENEINRWSINSFYLEQGLLHVEDDKLVIYLQHEKPTNENHAKNWLPTPAEGFRMTPRFYGPSTSLNNGTYDMPKIIKVKQ